MHLVEEIGQSRYRFHDLLRLYARELGQTNDSHDARGAATSRLLNWYLATAARASYTVAPWEQIDFEFADTLRQPTFREHADAWAWLELELNNLIVAAGLAARNGHPDIGWRIPLALFDYFHVVKSWGTWIKCYVDALNAARDAGDRYGEAWMHHGLSVAEFSDADLQAIITAGARPARATSRRRD